MFETMVQSIFYDMVLPNSITGIVFILLILIFRHVTKRLSKGYVRCLWILLLVQLMGPPLFHGSFYTVRDLDIGMLAAGQSGQAAGAAGSLREKSDNDSDRRGFRSVFDMLRTGNGMRDDGKAGGNEAVSEVRENLQGFPGNIIGEDVQGFHKAASGEAAQGSGGNADEKNIQGGTLNVSGEKKQETDAFYSKDGGSNLWLGIRWWGMWIWFAGAVLLLAYYFYQFCVYKKKLKAAEYVSEQGYWVLDQMDTPFVMPGIPPRIYLPEDLTQTQLAAVLAHERQHIRNLDPLLKCMMLAAAAIYWFHPFVWMALRIFGKDMEMYCDECVLRGKSMEERKAYSGSLLEFAAKSSGVALTMDFGKSNAEQRIRHILQVKKASRAVSFLLVLFVSSIGIFFLSSKRVPGSSQQTVGMAGGSKALEHSNLGDTGKNTSETARQEDLHRNGYMDEVKEDTKAAETERIIRVLQQVPQKMYTSAVSYEKNMESEISRDHVVLLTEYKHAGIKVYGYESRQYGTRGMVVDYHGTFSFFDFRWMGTWDEPKLYMGDFDRDSIPEIAFTFISGYGSGVIIEGLRIFEIQNDNTLLCHEMNTEMSALEEALGRYLRFDETKGIVEVVKDGQTVKEIDFSECADYKEYAEGFEIVCGAQISIAVKDNSMKLRTTVLGWTNNTTEADLLSMNDAEENVVEFDITYQDGEFAYTPAVSTSKEEENEKENEKSESDLVIRMLREIPREAYAAAVSYEKNSYDYFEKDHVVLLAEDSDAGLKLYGYESETYSTRGMMLDYHGTFSYFDIPWQGWRYEPELYTGDFDGDSMPEFAFTYLWGYGTGANIHGLRIFEIQKDDSLICHEMDVYMDLQTRLDPFIWFDRTDGKAKIVKDGKTMKEVDFSASPEYQKRAEELKITCTTWTSFEVRNDRILLQATVLGWTDTPSLYVDGPEDNIAEFEVLYRNGKFRFVPAETGK